MSREIIKCTQYDLMKAKAKLGQMYFTTDSRALYKDNGSNMEQRLRFNAVILNTESERANSVKPVIGKFYYVEETNSLWLYDTRWVLKIGDSTYYNTYYAGEYISPVVNIDNSITGEFGDKIIDNNGLLGDGSVIVRDTNRILRAAIKSDTVYNNVSIKSYLDDGLLFIPNAHLPYSDLTTSLGALHLTVDRKDNDSYNGLNLKGNAYYYGDWNNYGDMYSIQKANDVILPDYVPINDYEVVKFYIECIKIVEERNQKTHISIRPISDSSAIIHIISLFDEEVNSVVKNDMGELIFTNNGNLVENQVYECTRKILSNDTYSISEYVLDNYNTSIILKQNKESTTIEFEIPEEWYDASSRTIISAEKWIKNKMVTIDVLQKEIDSLKNEIEQLKNS